MKIEIVQAIQDRLAEIAAPLTPAERYELWPESQYGGDGPWNNYGGDEEEGPPAPYVRVEWVNDGPPAHDFF